MRFFSTLLCALVAPRLIAATALTYRLAPSETACFFTSVDTAGSKIAFYFAVGGHLALVSEMIYFIVIASSPQLPCPRNVSLRDQTVYLSL